MKKLLVIHVCPCKALTSIESGALPICGGCGGSCVPVGDELPFETDWEGVAEYRSNPLIYNFTPTKPIITNNFQHEKSQLHTKGNHILQQR